MPSLFTYGIRALFPCYASYNIGPSLVKRLQVYIMLKMWRARFFCSPGITLWKFLILSEQNADILRTLASDSVSRQWKLWSEYTVVQSDLSLHRLYKPLSTPADPTFQNPTLTPLPTKQVMTSYFSDIDLIFWTSAIKSNHCDQITVLCYLTNNTTKCLLDFSFWKANIVLVLGSEIN